MPIPILDLVHARETFIIAGLVFRYSGELVFMEEEEVDRGELVGG